MENLKQPTSNLTGGWEEEVTTKFKKLRSRLDSEQKRLLEELEQLQTNVASIEVRREGSPFGKREEEATESFELEKRLALEKQIRDQLVEVEHALHKFEKETYGLCDSCGKSIDPARLEVLPQASLCMDCKAKNEHGRSSSG